MEQMDQDLPNHEPLETSAPTAHDISGRDRLIEAARVLFRGSGYREVSVSEITKTAGIQAPTLYHHFGDKEGLYSAWAESSLAGLGQHVAAGLVGKTGTRECLVAIAWSLLDYRELDLLVVLRDARRELSPKAQERVIQGYLAAVVEPLGSVLVRGVERGKLRPEPIARMAQAFVLGVLSLHPSHAMETVIPEEAAVWFTKRFLNGFSS